MARIRKPYKYKVFADKSVSKKVSPSKFGTSKLVNRPDQWDCIANLQYEIGAESIIGCMSTQDLNSIFHYITTALGYVYQQGIVEYNPYQDYYKGSVVQYKGKIYILKKEWIEGLKEPKHCEDPNPCNPCGCPEEPVELNTDFEDTNTWFTLATVEDLNSTEEKLINMLEAIKKELNRRINELESDLNELEFELKELVSKTKEGLVSDLNKLGSNLNELVSKTKKELVSDIKELESKTKEELESNINELESKTKEELESNLNELESDLKELASKNKEELGQAIKNSVSNLNESSLKVESKITVNNTAGLNSTNTKVNGTGTAITAGSIAKGIADDATASGNLAKGLSGKAEVTSDKSLNGKGTVADPLTVNTGKGIKKDPTTGEITFDPSSMTKEDAKNILKVLADSNLLGNGLSVDSKGNLIFDASSLSKDEIKELFNSMLSNDLIGDGIALNSKGQLYVKTESIKSASGKHHFYALVS